MSIATKGGIGIMAAQIYSGYLAAGTMRGGEDRETAAGQAVNDALLILATIDELPGTSNAWQDVTRFAPI